MFVILFLGITVHLSGQSIYFLGNSFTESSRPDVMDSQTTYPAGVTVNVGWSTYSGKNLDYISSNPTLAAWNSGGNWDSELANNDWDVIVMQPHTDPSGHVAVADEVAAVGTILSQARSAGRNASTKVFIFGPWPWKEAGDKDPWFRDFEQSWVRDYSPTNISNNDLFNVIQPFEGLLTQQLTSSYPAEDIDYIPVGEVVFRTGYKLNQTPHLISSITTMWDVFDTPGVHLVDDAVANMAATYIPYMTCLSRIFDLPPSSITSSYADFVSMDATFKDCIDTAITEALSSYETTSKLPVAPAGVHPYQSEPVWPHITFDKAVDITLLEPENKIYVSEQFGKIWTLPSDLTASPTNAVLVADLGLLIPDFQEVYGITFHPDFSVTPECYIQYRVQLPDSSTYVRVSRFSVNGLGEIMGDGTGSDLLIDEYSEDHSGGDLQFGPDDMLYVPLGDLASYLTPDGLENGQDPSTLGSTMLRIDVNSSDPGLNYAIPPDNPFVGSSWIREEVWAYGLRKPWKISFHPDTGELFVGDVGYVDWDELHIVKKGGNYGWSVREGPTWFDPNQETSPAPIESPIALLENASGVSITGGYFVESDRLPELEGSYIYGDWSSGKIYELTWDGDHVTTNREIADTSFQIVSFGQDQTGDLIFSSWQNNTSLQRLIKRPPIYVDEDATSGADDGSSWTNAFLTLQSALAVAVNGDEIWVAEGTYYPDEGTGQTNGLRTSSFQLIQGVEIYGGFVGTETQLSERNKEPETNNTILSGDLNKDDDTGGDISENAYHIVTSDLVDNSAKLDGFSITSGNANGDGGSSQNIGGGIMLLDCLDPAI